MAKSSLAHRQGLIPQPPDERIAGNLLSGVASDPAELKSAFQTSAALLTTLPLPYEWLFCASAEAVLIVSLADFSIVAANPAAAALLRISRSELVGNSIVDIVHGSSQHDLRDSLARASESGAAGVRSLLALDRRASISADFSAFRHSEGSYLIGRLKGAAAPVPQIDQLRSRSPVFEAIEGAASGFLVTDSELRIEYANRAFMDMVDLSVPEGLLGQPLTRWLEVSREDQILLDEQMSTRQAVAVLAAKLRSERSTLREVEIHAVAVPDGLNSRWGFSIREYPCLN